MPTGATLKAAYDQLPLAFEANQGQAAAPINFVARGIGYALSLTPTKAVLGLQKPASTPAAATTQSPGDVVQLQLAGANPATPAIGLDKLITKSNYYVGNDPSQWHTNVPNFGKVEYQNIYPGVNLVYYGNQGQLEYDFVVAPGADPGAITLAVQGIQGMMLDGQGNLVLHTGGGDVVEQAPVLYQDIGGVHQAVSGRFVLEGNSQVGFQVGPYDASRPLIIDPVLSYATYLGGSGSDFSYAIAVDSAGNAYVTGRTTSTNFPTTASFGSPSGGPFVTKLNGTGSAVVYSTILGGGAGYGIAVDTADNAYVTGVTSASNFPTTLGALQTAYGGGSQDAFVTKLDPSGNLVYSTYLGGSGTEGSSGYSFGNPIAVDSAGNAYVVGPTSSANFPTTSNASQATLVGTSAGYITEIDPTGNALIYSTYLTGGPGNSVALGSGQIYVTGSTTSASFPTTPGAYQKSLSRSGDTDAFVAVLNPSLPTAAQFVYATYLGGHAGSRRSDGNGIAVDSSGNAYVTGTTFTSSFPTTAGAFQTNYPRGAYQVAFVAKINPSGSGSASLVYSTYLGSESSAQGNGIAVDGAGNAYVTGGSYGSFPMVNPIQSNFGSAYEAAYVTTFNASGSALLFSTYLGGTNKNNRAQPQGIALDTSGNIYVTGLVCEVNGTSYPLNFPMTSGAFQTTWGGGYDAFVAKVSAVVTAAAALSPNVGKELPVAFTAHPLSPATIAESIDSLLATQSGVAPQQAMFHPRVLDKSASTASSQPQRWDAQNIIATGLPWSPEKRSAAEIMDRVFADFGTELDSVGQVLF